MRNYIKAIALTPIVFLPACVSLPNSTAICDGTIALRKAHAGALLADGGPRSQETGERLLSGLQAGCDG